MATAASVAALCLRRIIKGKVRGLDMKSTCACNPRIWPCLSRVQTEKAANILKKSLIKNNAERTIRGK